MSNDDTLMATAKAPVVAIGSLGAPSSSVIVLGSVGKIQRLDAISKAEVSNLSV